MPDESQSPALREFRTSFNPAVRELWTLELAQARQDIADLLDLVFCIDISSTMGAEITLIGDILADLATALSPEYTSVKYAVVTFRDEDTTTIATGAGFVSQATCQAVLNGLAASGGGDTPNDGFGAITKACSLPFREDAARAVVIVTKTRSHERGKTFVATKNNLLNTGAVLFSGVGHDDPDDSGVDYAGLDSLVENTGGSLVDGDAATLPGVLGNALKKLAQPVQDPVFLVNDNENLVANIEGGFERTFLRRSFAINPFASGEDGALSVSLTMDNSDFAVSRYLATARKFPIPLELKFRVFMSNDLTAPAGQAVTLFATDFETKGTVVSCQVRWLDLQNASFPNAFYTTTRCPSLQ